MHEGGRTKIIVVEISNLKSDGSIKNLNLRKMENSTNISIHLNKIGELVEVILHCKMLSRYWFANDKCKEL